MQKHMSKAKLRLSSVTFSQTFLWTRMHRSRWDRIGESIVPIIMRNASQLCGGFSAGVASATVLAVTRLLPQRRGLAVSGARLRGRLA